MSGKYLPLGIAAAASLLAIMIACSANSTILDIAGSLTRWTARFGLPLFLLSFIASSLRHFIKQSWTASLLKQRRYWGLGFALVHTVHMIGFTLIVWNDDIDQTFADLAGGGAIYALMYLMVFTSNNWSVRKFGRYWRGLHLLGAHGLWIGFTVAYSSRVLGITLGPDFSLWDFFASALLYGVMIIRIAAIFDRRRKSKRHVVRQ